MAMAIELSMVIKTSAFFHQLLFFYNYHRMTIGINGLDTNGINCCMGLDQVINSCLSLYHNIAVLSFWHSLDADYFC